MWLTWKMCTRQHTKPLSTSHSKVTPRDEECLPQLPVPQRTSTYKAGLSTSSSSDYLPMLSCFSRVWLCATPETAAHQAPPSLGSSRQEHWSGFSRESSLSLSLIFFLFLAILQFGLLSHISSLRLSSGHSGLVLTLSMQPVPPCSTPAPW